MKRIFYQINGRMNCCDSTLIKETSHTNIYRIIGSGIKAIKHNHSKYENKSKILYHNNNTTKINVGHVRQKDKQYEQYIVGRDCFEDRSELDIYGEINDNVWSESSEVVVKVNDAIVATGNGDNHNYWSWSLRDNPDTVETSLHGQSSLSDFYGGKNCVVVSSDNPINSVGIYDN
jgi:hypothetical protein